MAPASIARQLLKLAVTSTFLLSFAALAEAPAGKVPLTTSSEAARTLFLQGRDLSEALRVTDAHAFFEKAVAADPNFATAWLFLANTSANAKDFFSAQAKAVALAGQASEGERLAIQAAQAGTNSDQAAQARLLTKVIDLFPEDERAQTALGIFYFGQQDWGNSVAHLQKATEIAPAFALPYNQLGYAYRFQGKYPEAEATFKKYTELVPKDPNPYDSYAELLMKMGRFEDSIAAYKKALEIDPNFVASYVGIGHDQILLGRGDEARKTFGKMLSTVARNEGERRQALFWLAMSHLHEGRYDEALKLAAQEEDIAKKINDLTLRSQDLNFMGNILLQAGKVDAAAAKFAESVKVSSSAEAPAQVKEAALRNSLFNVARVAIKRGDLKKAEALAADYRTQVEAKKVRFELWQSHELTGMIALEKKDYASALDELAKSNPRDPRVMFLTAVALRGKGDKEGALAMAQKAAEYNEITNPNFAYVRAEAKKLLGKAKKV